MDALRRHAGDRAGDAHQHPAELLGPVAVLSAPLRRAASTSTVPRLSAAISRLRDRKRTLVGADRAAPRTRPRSRARCGRSARGGRRGRHGRRRRPARRRWHRRPPARRGGPAWSMPVAPHRTPPAAPLRATAGGDVGGDVEAVGRRRPRPDDRDRVGQLGRAASAPAPRARPGRPPRPWTRGAVGQVVELAGPLVVARARRTGCPRRSACSSSDAGRRSTAVQRGPRSSRSGVVAPSSSLDASGPRPRSLTLSASRRRRPARPRG